MIKHHFKNFIILFCLCGTCTQVQAEVEEPLLIFAAASLTDVMAGLEEQFERQFGERIVVSLAASSALARQIENGAPADVFISADQSWMDYLDRGKKIVAKSRRVITTNTLVVIGGHEVTPNLDLTIPGSFAEELNGENFTMADPSHVPAGYYGMSALEALGIWQKVSTLLIPTENVRIALALVSRGEVSLGIVYSSDAQSDSGVQILSEIPSGSHPPIVYPAAAIRNGKIERANSFIEFLTTEESQLEFEKHGFGSFR